MMHLLAETAINDSSGYEVLSLHQVDDLKKQLSLLSSRMDAVKHKLVLESKLYDAASSLNRFQSTNGTDSTDGARNISNPYRRSQEDSRGGDHGLTSMAGGGVVSNISKCEDLAVELWKLEGQMQDMQKRLTEHNTGVLKTAYEGFLRKGMLSPSLEKELKHSHDEGSLHVDGLHSFDDHSFYDSLDSLLDLENGNQEDSGGQAVEQLMQQTQRILEIEQRLKQLNEHLRESTLETNVSLEQQGVTHVPDLDDKDTTVGLQKQLDHLEKGYQIMQNSQNLALQNAKKSMHATEERLEDLNTQLNGIISRSNQPESSKYPLPPEISGQSPEAQMYYFVEALDTVEQTIQRLIDTNATSSSRSAANEERVEHFETVFQGLWDMLSAKEEELRQWSQEKEENGLEKPTNTRSSFSKFSLQEFSTKVQAMCTRSTELQGQKEILARQVKQQRELNTKSETEKDAQLSDLTLELDQVKKALLATRDELKSSNNKLVLATEHLTTVQQEKLMSEQQNEIDRNTALQAEKIARIETEERLSVELQAKQDQVNQQEAELQMAKNDLDAAKLEMVDKLQQSENHSQELASQLDSLKDELNNRRAAEETLIQNMDRKTQEAEKAHEEFKALELEMVRLQTEMTMAKAELDGAYGTRAQRAEKVASHPNFQKEMDELIEHNSSLSGELTVLTTQHSILKTDKAELMARMQTLQRELLEAINEYEVMTRSCIEFEKDREQLENTIDKLRVRCESLESELSDEKVRWLGVKSPGSSGGKDSTAAGTTSTMVLKNEFKKMMKETRAENVKALRVSQTVLCKLDWAHVVLV